MIPRLLGPVLIGLLLLAAACGSGDHDSQTLPDDDSLSAIDASGDEADASSGASDIDDEDDQEKDLTAQGVDDKDGDAGAAESSEDGEAPSDESTADSPDSEDSADAADSDSTDETSTTTSETSDDATSTTSAESTTTSAPTEQTTTAAQSNPAPAGGSAPLSVDWWGCWQAADARGQGGAAQDGGRVATLPNCATGPSSVGSAGDMSHPNSPPIFRSSGAAGHPSIEFTFEGDTLLQTNGGQPWSGGDVMNGSNGGVTLAWVGMTLDVNSHSVKYLVSGLNDSSEYPMLLVEGEGPNRFAGWGGGGVEARSSNGSVVDNNIHGVILYLSGDGSSSVVEVDGRDVNSGQDSRMQGDVNGLTLGNIFSRNFSTTDHQFVFLGLLEGEMSSEQKSAFWSYVDSL